jgi:hypothetical protein
MWDSYFLGETTYISVSALNTTVKNDHVIDENTNQQQRYQNIFFKAVNTQTIFVKTFVAFDKWLQLSTQSTIFLVPGNYTL